MKSQIFTTIALLVTGVAAAQTQKGNGILSGDMAIGYSTLSYNSINNTQTWTPSLNLTVGKFVADNWLVGASVDGSVSTSNADFSYFSGSGTQTGVVDVRNASAYITPFVRRYWQFAPVQVFVGGGLSVGVSYLHQTGQQLNTGTSTLVPTETKTNNLAINPELQAGVNYFLTNRLALQLTASASSLPFGVAGLRAGLVYWTGSNLGSSPQPERINPQTARGNWLIEGSFATTHASDALTSGLNESRSTAKYYSIAPAVGYFVGRNTLVGIAIPLIYSTETANFRNPSAVNAYNSDTWSIGLSPYVQRYLMATRLTPYARVSATYLLRNPSPGFRQKSLAGALSFGLAYMAGQRFIVETSLASLNYESLPEDNIKRRNTSLSAGLSGNFAVRYVLNRSR